MLCSTIIPTVGRLTLARAVESVLAQGSKISELEVIVVNDSGAPLPVADWQQSEQVQIINTHRRERSVARNAGAAISKGKYLHFLDDDDWLFPDAYQNLLELSRVSNAKWLYGMTQLVNRQNEPSIQLRHGMQGNCFVQAMAGEWIPLQASWIDSKTFFAVGGFNPLLKGPEDIDLLRRVLVNEEIAETPNLIAQVIMGGEGSTTNYLQHPLSSRWAREIILEMPAAFHRLRSSASTPVWRGRTVRIYLTSAVWNLQRRRFFAFLNRIFYTTACVFNAGGGIFSEMFWRALTKPYASETFAEGILRSRQA